MSLLSLASVDIVLSHPTLIVDLEHLALPVWLRRSNGNEPEYPAVEAQLETDVVPPARRVVGRYLPSGHLQNINNS